MTTKIFPAHEMTAPARPAKRKGRRRLLRFATVALPLTLLAVAVLFFSILPALLRAGAFRGRLERALSKISGGRASVGKADLVRGSLLILQNVTVENPPLGRVEIPELRARFGLSGLRSITLDRPTAVLEIAPEQIRIQGGPAGPIGPLSLPKIRVINGSIRGRPCRVERFSLEARAADGQGRLKLDFAEASFVWNDLTLDRLTGSLETDITQKERSSYEGRLKLAMSEGAFQKKAFFQELQGHLLTLTVDGTVDPENKVYDLKGADLSLEGLGGLHVEGRAAGDKVRLEAATTELALSELAQRLNGLALDLAASGQARLRLSVQEDESVRGRILLKDVSARQGAVVLRGLNGEVPFLLGRGAAERGWVGWNQFAVRDTATGPQRLEVVSRPGLTRFASPGEIPLFGGRCRIGEILLRASDGFLLETSIETEDVNLSLATGTLGMSKPIQGTLRGSFPVVRLTPSRIDFKGGASADVWDGRIDFSDFSVIQPFDPRLLAYRFRFDGNDIHLRSICEQATDFGLLTGTLRGGGVLELFRTGEPQEMDVRIEADPRSGGSVDLKAVRSLAKIIEGNSKTSNQIRKIPRNTLYYESFGFRARLRPNGTFSIRGLYYMPDGTSLIREYTPEEIERGEIKPEAAEYIMVGKGFSQINVFNTPGKAIDFEDLLERLRQKPEDEK